MMIFPASVSDFDFKADSVINDVHQKAKVLKNLTCILTTVNYKAAYTIKLKKGLK